MPDAEITIPNRKILQSLRALQQLDASDEKSKPLYKFLGGANFRLAMSKRLRRIADMAKDLNDQQVRMAKEVGYIGDGKDDRNVSVEFNTAVAELLDSPDTFQMAKLPLANLDLENNPVPMWVLAELDWLFDE